MKTKIYSWLPANLQLSLLSALFVFAGSPALPAQTPTPPNPGKEATGPRIQFAETSFDFQKVQPADKPTHDFIFTNTGNLLLEITGVQPSCGCTSAGAWDRQVEPGKTGKISLTFNPANFNGPISKGAMVTCNAPGQNSIYLQFQATVWRPFEVQPQSVYFLPVEGEPLSETKSVRIVNNLSEAVTLDTPRSSNPAFQTELKTVQPGKEFQLVVSYFNPLSNANAPANITIKTSSTNLSELSVTAMVIPQPALVVVPPQLQLPASPLQANYHLSVSIHNRSSVAVKLSDASVNAEGAAVRAQEQEPGKAFLLDLTFPPDFQVRPGQPVELAVKTSHSKYPVLKVPITQTASTGLSSPSHAAATIAK